MGSNEVFYSKTRAKNIDWGKALGSKRTLKNSAVYEKVFAKFIKLIVFVHLNISYSRNISSLTSVDGAALHSTRTIPLSLLT